MADVASGKQWREFFSKHTVLPPAFDREHASPQITTPFCLSLNTVQGVAGKGNGDKEPEYQVYVSLYDLAYRRFFGRQWVGPLRTAQGGGDKRPKLKYSQSVYFHTSINNPNVVAVVEVIAQSAAENGKPKKVSCGWGIVRIFSYENEIPDSSRSANLPTQKVQLNYGSPRALYFMDDPIESNPALKPIPECQLSYTLGTHKAMYKILGLLPENAVVGANDIIPGLLDGQNPGKDHMRKPKLLRQVPIQIEGLHIQLQPNVEKFEEELCELLHNDRMKRENHTLSGSSVSVVERRLLAGVHNGWTYLEKPEVLHLDVYDESSRSLKPQASPSLRRSKRFLHSSQRSLTSNTTADSSTLLILKNKIELNELLEDPLLAVVFTLEYVVSESLSEEERKLSRSLARGTTRTISIRWGVWNPFFQPNMPKIDVALLGGPSKAPDDQFIYKMPNTSMQNLESSKTAGGLISLYWQSKDGGVGLPVESMPTHAGLPGSMASVRSMDGSDAMLIDSPSSRKPPISKQSYSHLPPYTHNQAMGARHASLFSLPHSDYMGTTRSGPLSTEPYNVGPMSLQVPQIQPQMMQPQYGSMMPPQMGPPQVYYPVQQGMPGAYGMEISHMRDPNKSLGMTGHEMHELPYTPAHAPIMAQLPQPDRRQGLSRAAYAKLYAADFKKILDRNNEPPEVIDLTKNWVIDLEREAQDPLQSNEIVFQFLAFSKIHEGDPPSKATDGSVFFTFQFYRLPQVTTERLMLAKPQTEVSSSTPMPYILQKLESDGNMTKGPAGFDVRFEMNPMYMKPGENNMFLNHLSRQTLYIDVWDGDSLLLIGSCAIELKYLCRNGNEAVQSTFELDVITTEYEDEPNLVHGGGGKSGGAQPIGVKSYTKGKLHFRMANVGHMVDPKASITAPITIPSKSQIVISQTAGNSAFPGGSLAASFSTKQGLSPKKKVARARHIAEKNREVSQLLFSQKDQVIPERDTNEQGDKETQRKLARMNLIRQQEGIDNKYNTLMTYKTEKQERMRDYKTLEIYRLQTKRDGIISMLSQSITTDHVIHPAFATTEFFEFVLKNPYNVEQTITIEYDEPDLSVIMDAREWRYFKQINGMPSQVEEGMFNRENQTKHPTLFLRPKEKVHIPFKYLTFTADQTVHPQGPQDPFRAPEKKKTQSSSKALEEKVVKVVFRGEDEKAISIMNLSIEPQPHIVDQTFRFYHPEQSFLKKSMRLPGSEELPGAPTGSGGLTQIYVRCSDVNVITESKPVQTGEPIDVFMKVALGASPQIKRFFMAMYLDPFLTKPIQTWQFFIHALQRVDVSCVEGQTSKFNLLLRGTQASRLVRCFSSHPQEMQLYPSEQFLLAAGAVHELSVAVRPLREGHKYFYLNVVDVEYHQLIRTWLVCVSCRAPTVSRAFELTLPIGGGKGSSKKITYTNPYPYKRVFHLLTNREDLLQFRDNRIEIEGGETYTIGLKFIPVMKLGQAEILVFINDDEDKNEETFRIMATYQ